MTNVIDLTVISGKTDLGYTQGLPLGISVVDSNGAIAPIITTVVPSTGTDGTDGVATTGMMYYSSTANTLYVRNGTAWKTLSINT